MLTILLSGATAVMADLPKASQVPGGIALVRLGPIAEGGKPPLVWLGQQRVLVATKAGEWIAVTGLDLATPAGRHELQVTDDEQTRLVSFEVADKRYPEQRITLKDASKVQLSVADLARVEREVAQVRLLKRHWRESEKTDLAFVVPADGRMTGRFGARRYFNGEARAPHAGFDIAVPRGAPVRANADGIVLAADDYFFNGKTVFVDHGNGVISMYCHLDHIAVRAGETVTKGKPIGRAGMTGRATGPHLHWSVILNGAMVDPELFLRPTARY